MSDRNKTELTQNITRNVALWLDSKGFKPVETEVGVEAGWLADVAGVCCPTQTEMINLKLIKPPPRWNSHRDKDEFGRLYQEWNANRDALPKMVTATIEVKTSVGDFRGDRKWTAENWPTNLCYVAMPAGMIPEDKWPSGWGVILFSKEGTTVRKVYPSALRPSTHEQQLNVVLSLAIRRDHVTRYARLRELQKEVRISDGERKTMHRFTEVIGVVRSAMKGVPIEEALRWGGIRSKLPAHVLEDLRGLKICHDQPAPAPQPWDFEG